MTTAAQRTETTTALSKDQLLRMYRRMYSIREFEEHANDLYLRALMPGLTHLYEGEEAVAVGICEALRPDDYITSTHRGHGHCLAKGAKPDRMFAELLGKEAGYCRGKGGSMRGDCHRRGVFRQEARQWQNLRLFLWRGRARPGGALRSHEYGAALEATRGLRLREQYVQRIYALLRNNRRGNHGSPGRFRHPGGNCGWAGCASSQRHRIAACRSRA